MATTTLPRPGSTTADYDAKLSLTRTLQMIGALEDGLASVLGSGVVSGGRVTHTTGYTIFIASGTVFFCGGYLLTLGSAQTYSAASASATVYVFAAITRTAANKANPTDLDTYALTVTHNTTGTSPGATYFPMAVLKTDGAGVLSIMDAPDGKKLKIKSMFVTGANSLASTESECIGTNETRLVKGPITISGHLEVLGQLEVL